VVSETVISHQSPVISEKPTTKAPNPLFFRAFVLSPAPWNAVVFNIPLGCFRDEFFGFHSVFCLLSSVFLFFQL
jgi:hypothetical protein